MIGFRPSNTTRRPLYSVTGEKLGYLTSGPKGDQFYTVAGRKVARITGWKQVADQLEACSTLAGSVVFTPESE